LGRALAMTGAVHRTAPRLCPEDGRDHLTLDGDDPRWSMPKGYPKKAHGQKTAPAHDVPVGPQVVNRLCGIERMSVFVFPAKRGHKKTTALDKAVHHKDAIYKNGVRVKESERGGLPEPQANGTPVGKFTPHDLRRTSAALR